MLGHNSIFIPDKASLCETYQSKRCSINRLHNSAQSKNKTFEPSGNKATCLLYVISSQNKPQRFLLLKNSIFFVHLYILNFHNIELKFDAISKPTTLRKYSQARLPIISSFLKNSRNRFRQ